MQARMRAITDVVSALVQRVKSGKDVDLNAIKREAAIKYTLSRAPKLVEIIAALPEEHRAVLLPQCVPTRLHLSSRLPPCRSTKSSLPRPESLQAARQARAHRLWHRRGCRHVQAPPLPPHLHHRQHLRLLPWGPRLRL